MTAGRIALVGSGEYLPVMDDVERWLLEGSAAGTYVQLATAAAPEGQGVLDHWHRLGAKAAARQGVEQVVIDIRTRDDAFDERWVPLIEGARLVYLSGGNPTHLAKVLRDSPAWAAILRTWQAGAALAGCSAGAMALCGYVPDFRHPRRGGENGLGVVPDLRVLPHFDRYTKWVPDFAMRPLMSEGVTVVGIDEDTALIGEAGEEERAPWLFRSRGRQSSWRLDHDRTHRVNGTLAVDVSLGR
jgi:cyanophycinase